MAEIKSFTAYHRIVPVKKYFGGPLFMKAFMKQTRHSLEKLFRADGLRIYCRDPINGYFVSVWSSNGAIKRVACDENCGRLHNAGDLLRMPLKNGLRLTGMIEVVNRKDGRGFDWHDEQMIGNLGKFIGCYFKQPMNIFAEYGKCTALTERTLVNPELLNGMLARATRRGMPVENVLLKNRPAIRANAIEAFNRLYGIPFFNIDDETKISGGLFKSTRLDFMLDNSFIPVKVQNDAVAVVVDNPFDVLKINRIRNHFRKKQIRFHWCFQQNIKSYLRIFQPENKSEKKKLDDDFLELDLMLDRLDD